jgi:hypothetical protein
MSLGDRINTSTVLNNDEKRIMHLLANRALTTDEITGWGGYSNNLERLKAVSAALDGLNRKGLLKIDSIKINRLSLNPEVYLTFSIDWVFKL